MIIAISATEAQKIREDRTTYKMRFRANSLIDVDTFLATLDVMSVPHAILSIKRIDDLWNVRIAELTPK